METARRGRPPDPRATRRRVACGGGRGRGCPGRRPGRPRLRSHVRRRRLGFGRPLARLGRHPPARGCAGRILDVANPKEARHDGRSTGQDVLEELLDEEGGESTDEQAFENAKGCGPRHGGRGERTRGPPKAIQPEDCRPLLTSVLGRGDRLVVSELSRLGRSLGQIVTILDALAKAGVAFVALKENIRVRGQARHPDEGHDDALRAVRRGRARPDLRAYPRGPRPSQVLGPEARSARRDRWASHGSPARRTRSAASSS